jgi:hypothetical protein
MVICSFFQILFISDTICGHSITLVLNNFHLSSTIFHNYNASSLQQNILMMVKNLTLLFWGSHQ